MENNTKSKRKVGAAFASIILAVLMLALCAVSFFVTNGAKNRDALDIASSENVSDVTAFSEDYVRQTAIFADNTFKRATSAAIAYTGKDSDLEKIATALSFETILVTDDKGKITASYPEGEAGKYLKDDKNTAPLNVVAKGIAVKKLGDPQKTDGGYSVYAAVARQDAGGAVAVKMAADEYADVCGETLAGKCGENVIIEKDGKVVSSSFADAGDKTIKELGAKENGEHFEIKLDKGKTYSAKVEKAGDYTVLTAIEKGMGGKGNPNSALIIGITALALTVAGCALIFLTGKKKEE